MRLFAALAALATLQGGATPTPQSANRDPQPAVRNPQSQLVCIDVIPSDTRGRIVDTLKPADFSVFDDGAPQPLESVRFIRPTSDAARLVAIFLDEYHVSAAATSQVRTSITRFVEQSLRPQDLLAVMKPLDSLFAIRLTQDRTEALQAIEAFEGRSGDYAPRNTYERNFMAGGPARLEQARTQIVLSAINALAVHFASFTEQRKTLIVVSEGMNQGERRRGMEFLPTVETIVRSAQDSNVSIYAVSPKAEAADNDALRGLAVETMGQASTLNLEDGLTRALQDASGYYLLTYRVKRPDDGTFHTVQVQIKRAATAIRARNGYFAPTPDAALRATLLAQMNAPKPVVPLEPAPHASVLIRSWFGTSRGADGKTRVTFVWEPAARLTGERHRRTPTRVVLTALAPDNSVLFEGTVNATGPGQTDDGAVVPSRAVFEMVPGRLRVRMSIQDAAQQVLDTDVRSISVREMRGVCIGTPEILRARNAREFRALDSEGAVPVASREFSRAERLLIRFMAYGPPGATLRVTARLFSRMGPMRDLGVTDDDSGRSEIDLPLAGLAVGEYIVEVSADGAGGDSKDVVSFRVTT